MFLIHCGKHENGPNCGQLTMGLCYWRRGLHLRTLCASRGCFSCRLSPSKGKWRVLHSTFRAGDSPPDVNGDWRNPHEQEDFLWRWGFKCTWGHVPSGCRMTGLRARFSCHSYDLTGWSLCTFSRNKYKPTVCRIRFGYRRAGSWFFFFFFLARGWCTRNCRARRGGGWWGGGGQGEGRGCSGSSQTMYARNSSKEPLRAFLFSSRASLKIETGLDRDPEIDRGHHSYKRHAIQEYSVCTVWRGDKSQRTFLIPRPAFCPSLAFFSWRFYWKDAPPLHRVSSVHLSCCKYRCDLSRCCTVCAQIYGLVVFFSF